MARARSRARDVTALLLAGVTAAAAAAVFCGIGGVVAVTLAVALLAATVALASGAAARLLGAAATGLVFAAAWVDDALHRLYGIHLYERAVTSLVGEHGANDVVHVGAGEAAAIVAVIVAAAAASYALVRGWMRLLDARATPSRALVATIAGVVVVADAAAWLAARRAVADALPARADAPEALKIYYPKTTGPRPKLARRPNIVVVLVETLRSDMLTPALMPELSRFATARACDRSLRHYSASHATDFSFFSLLYGLDSYHYLPFAQQKVPSYPLQLLHDNGYAVVGAASSRISAWGDLGDLTRQFDAFAEFPGAGPAERDRQLADWAMRWRREHGSERPYFMLLFFDATHHKYYYPPAFERFRPALPEDHNLVTGKVSDPATRLAFVNRYKNAVGYVDHLVAEVGADFAAAGGGDELVFVVTGDHGEEFWDNGLLGHTAVSFVNARTEVPLLLCLPERSGRRFPRSSEVDILPTLVDYARPSPPLPAAAYSNGVSLLGAPDPQRFLLVAGLGFPLTNRQVCLISPTRKYWLEKERSGAKRFVLQRTSDLDDRPAEPIAGELARGIDELSRGYLRFFSP